MIGPLKIRYNRTSNKLNIIDFFKSVKQMLFSDQLISRRSLISMSLLVFGIVIFWTLLLAPLRAMFSANNYSMANDHTQDTFNMGMIVGNQIIEPELKVESGNGINENLGKKDKSSIQKNDENLRIPGIDYTEDQILIRDEHNTNMLQDNILADLNSLIQKYPHHNSGLADKFYNEVKVLCWVNTWPANHKTKAKAV